jgi:hypothetical protein
MQENFDPSGRRVFLRTAAARHVTMLICTNGVDWPGQLFVTVEEKTIGGESVSTFVLAP